MVKKTNSALKKKTTARKTSGCLIKSISPNVVEINRRRQWRFDLPLSTTISGKLPDGKKFSESTKIENISSTGAYFCLDAGVVVGSRLDMSVDLPEKLGDGKHHRLTIAGAVVRLEKPERKGKSQGVAVAFRNEGQIIEIKG